MPRDVQLPKSASTKPKRVSVFIKIFVFLHLVAITCWSLPDAPKGTSFGVDRSSAKATARSIGKDISDGTLYLNQNYLKASPLKFYLMFSGFWQYWDMFSPNPAQIDFYGTATITYKDGRTSLYTFPRMYTMGIPQKYVSERYRKFYERAHPENDKWIWPTFAQRVAFLNYKDPNNPPVTVVLTRHWYAIPPPPPEDHERKVDAWKKEHPGLTIDTATDKEFWRQAEEDAHHNPTDAEYNYYNYFTYQVNQKRLQEDKAAGVLG